jgi:inorganic pyrophosphatase
MLLTKLPAFDDDDLVQVVVESPRGTTLKLKYDPDRDVFALSRPLVKGLAYPFDWGFVPSTKGPDGDPVDALVIWEETSFPGLVLACRPIAVLRVEQNSRKPGTRERNDRLLVVPAHAPRDQPLRDVSDVSARLRQELEAFFVASTTFENKDLKILEWANADAAIALVKDTGG